MFSYVEALEDQDADDDIETAYKVQANILWQPVKQMRMGWEVIWAETETYEGDSEDGVRATFGNMVLLLRTIQISDRLLAGLGFSSGQFFVCDTCNNPPCADTGAW